MAPVEVQKTVPWIEWTSEPGRLDRGSNSPRSTPLTALVVPRDGFGFFWVKQLHQVSEPVPPWNRFCHFLRHSDRET